MPGATKMGRPKKSAAKNVDRPPDDRVAIIHLKGSVLMSEWLDEFHRQTHIPKAVLFRLGLAEMAKIHKFRPPPQS